MKKYILSYLPFLVFITTYVYLMYYYQHEKIMTPVLEGRLLGDLTNDFSDNLMFKIFRVTYSKEYVDNYIISQYPLPGTLIRPNQIINIEVNNNKNKIIKNVKSQINGIDIAQVKEYYKKEGILYKIVNFNNSQNNNLKVFSNTYDQNKNLAYIYYNFYDNLPSLYIKNLIGKNCSDISSKHKAICYRLDNSIIENCSNKTIICQFPLPGKYDKKEENLIFHIWHS